MNTEWKKKPIEEALKGMKAVPHLQAAGFKTAGDVIDAKPEDIARMTQFIGVKRAMNLRDVILQDALRDAHNVPGFIPLMKKPAPAEKAAPAEFVEVEPTVVTEHLPISYQIALFAALTLSVITFIGLLFEATK